MALISLSTVVATRLLSYGVLLTRYEDAFGHQAWNLEYYAKKYYAIHGRFPKFVAFQRSNYAANKSLLNHHRHNGVHIFSPNSLLSYLFRLSRGAQKSEYTRTRSNYKNQSSAFLFCTFTMNELHVDPISCQNLPLAFPLSNEENQEAAKVLEVIGLLDSTYFCFQDRNYRYKKVIANDIGRPRFLERQRFENARNTSLSSFQLTIKDMASRDLTPVRIGAYPEQSCEFKEVIDYSSIRDTHSDFSDLAIMNSAKFFVGPNSGLWLFARSFDRPVCLINVFPWPWINLPMKKDDLVLPKKLWDKNMKKLLTVRQMAELESKFHWKNFYDDNFFDQISIEVIDNTPEEIRAAVSELNDRLDHKWAGPDNLVSSYLNQNNVAINTEASFPEQFVEANPELFT